jgi:rhodanese-related sulfurtransferase
MCTVIYAAILLGPATVATSVGRTADDAQSPRAVVTRPETSGGPYCGVYCVYAALGVHGIDMEFESLLQPRYISSHFGSSLGELELAVEDFGAHAEPLENLTAGTLRLSPYPIILHVRRPGFDTAYAHWVLFLGVEGDHARIVDPPNHVQLLPMAELLALWDGVGLVVSKEPIQTWPIQAASYLEQAIMLLLVSGALGLLWMGRSKLGFSRRAPWGIFAVVGLAAGAAVVNHLVHDEGLLRNRSALGQIVGRHFEPYLPSVSVAEVASLVGQDDVALLDARYPGAFDAGHLPGAVNLPISSGLVERAEILQRIPRDHCVIVYCQSERCAWGKTIASDLVFRGYQDVRIFAKGWNGWLEHERSKTAD